MLLVSNLTRVFFAATGHKIVPGNNVFTEKDGAKILASYDVKQMLDRGVLKHNKEVTLKTDVKISKGLSDEEAALKIINAHDEDAATKIIEGTLDFQVLKGLSKKGKKASIKKAAKDRMETLDADVEKESL